MNIIRTRFFLKGVIACCIMISTQAWAGEKLTVGSKWEIVGKIEVPPRKATIYYQDGRPTAALTGNQYAPWCALGFNTKDQQKYRTFVKGSFEITRITLTDESIDLTNTNYKTTMTLKSAEVSDVLQLACSNWDDAAGSYLTVKQMRQAMQGVLKLSLK